MRTTIKKIKIAELINILLFGFILLIASSCERSLSDDVEFATYPATPEIFIDGFSGGLEYLPFEGSKLTAFTVDDQTFYEGTTAMRFDVPSVGDPEGAFAGAIFPDYGGRDLSGFDALTFWAKATKAASINEIGFGQDFGENKYQVTKNNLPITTGWKKYIIPLPDPSKLVFERGMFWYAEGPEEGEGYTFWIDELRFEKLGTVAQPRPAIFNGEDVEVQTFIGSSITMSGLTQTFSLANGLNETVTAAPAYFTFESTNNGVALVNESGAITISGAGTATITASLGNVRAQGSFLIESLGRFTAAPTPTRDAANVVSVFSDAYENAAIDYYNGFFTPDGQTTQGAAPINIDGDQIMKYSELNFVAMKTLNSVNASAMTHYHIDIQVEKPEILGEDFIRLLLLDAGPDGQLGTGDESEASVTLTSADLVSNQWKSYDIPLSDFAGLNTSNLLLFFFISDGSNPVFPGTITDILVDNIYFYKE